MATEGGVLIAAGAPILDGFGHGPARGMVIIGRFLNQAELLRIGNQAQVKLDMRAWTGQPDARTSGRSGPVMCGLPNRPPPHAWNARLRMSRAIRC